MDCFSKWYFSQYFVIFLVYIRLFDYKARAISTKKFLPLDGGGKVGVIK